MSLLFASLKQKKYIIQGSIFFGFFIIIYFILDYLNMSYQEMITNYGIYLVVINIILNIIMAFLSSILLISSEVMIKGSSSSSLGFIAIIFGMFTYGCTTCVIAFLANFGIVFFVMILPFANLPYKLISLALIVLGLLLTNRRVKKGCKLKVPSR